MASMAVCSWPPADAQRDDVRSRGGEQFEHGGFLEWERAFQA